MFFNLIYCTARSAWVAFIITFFIFLFYLIKQKNKTYFKRIGVLLICFIIIFIYLLNGFSFITKIIQVDSNKTNNTAITKTQRKINRIGKEIKQAKETGNLDKMGSGRIKIWKITLKLISKVPFFGSGPDNLYNGLKIHCEEEINNLYKDSGKQLDKAHNEYLNIAATTGIPSLIVYLTFLFMIMYPKLKTIFKDKTILILSLAIISYLIQAFFNISTIGVAPLFWMLLGLIDNNEMINLIKFTCK